jgi:hypothetical protein
MHVVPRFEQIARDGRQPFHYPITEELLVILEQSGAERMVFHNVIPLSDQIQNP